MTPKEKAIERWKERIKMGFIRIPNNSMTQPFRHEAVIEEIIDIALKSQAKEIFDYLQNSKKVNMWDTYDVRGSSETESVDKWISLNVIEKVRKKFGVDE